VLMNMVVVVALYVTCPKIHTVVEATGQPVQAAGFKLYTYTSVTIIVYMY